MSNDFQQWNPTKTNQKSTADYIADATRSGGASSGIFPSDLANKLFYQLSTMVKALGDALSGKGYAISDTNISALTAILADLVTIDEFIYSFGASGYAKLPGGLILQWGVTGSISQGSHATVTFPTTFPTAVYFAGATPQSSADNTNVYSVGRRSLTTSGMIVTNNSGTSGVVIADWFAIGR